MNINEILAKFKEIERIVQRVCFEIGREIIKSILEEWDEYLRKSRDKGVYRHVGNKATTIKTVVGEVAYKRTQYEIIDEEGGKSYVYILDEAMGVSGSGHFSDLLCEMIVKACCASPYREAARTVSEMTGQSISHMAAWTVVQVLGKQVDEQEKAAAARATKSEGVGKVEAKILFEEQDGITLSLQGKDRKEHGERKDMKLVIAYDGAKKTGKNRYTLTNKVACANFEGVEEFVKRKDGVIADTYNVDEIEMRMLGGDGASWIRRSLTDETVHFQLDAYHRNKWVMDCVSDPEGRKRIMKLLYDKDIDLLLHVIEVEALSADDEKDRENYLKLLGYFQKNKDGLVPYQQRGLDIPEAPEGKEYRRMGSMESNIFTIIGNRMKGGRASWSIAGGNNLSRLLCLKFTGKLRDVLNSLSATVLPERYAEEITVEMSATKAPLREGKGYNGFHQALIPSTLKWLKDIAAIKPVYSF
jgi:hypothetical protein